MSEDQEKAADSALFQLSQALADLRALAATPDGERFLSDNYARLGAAINELREVSRKATLSAIGWEAT